MKIAVILLGSLMVCQLAQAQTQANFEVKNNGFVQVANAPQKSWRNTHSTPENNGYYRHSNASNNWYYAHDDDEKTFKKPVNTKTLMGTDYPEFTPGIVYPKQLNDWPLGVNVYVIGDDPISIKWALNHRAALKKMDAVGFAINVAPERFEALDRRLGLGLIKMRSVDVFKRVGVTHYPFLITNRRLTQ